MIPEYVTITRKLKPLFLSFGRYLLAGGVGFLLDYSVLMLCYKVFDIHYMASTVIGFVVGLVATYISSNFLVFDNRKYGHNALLEFIVFTVIGIIGLGLTSLFMWILVEWMDICPPIAKIFTTGIVLLWNFSARKFILY